MKKSVFISFKRPRDDGDLKKTDEFTGRKIIINIILLFQIFVKSRIKAFLRPIKICMLSERYDLWIRLCMCLNRHRRIVLRAS